MKITRVCCQGCGADLDVDESVRFVTCNYCQARLEVVHDTTVTHTRLMEKLERNTERIAGNLKVIELQNDLERLDREWSFRKEGFMVTGKDGSRSLPSEAGSMFGGGISVVFGLIVVAVGGQFGSFPVLFGLAAVVFGIWNAVSGSNKANGYKLAEADYRRERESLSRRIAESRSSP